MTFPYQYYQKISFKKRDPKRVVKRLAVKILLLIFKGLLIFKKVLSLLLFLVFYPLALFGKVILKFSALKFYKIYLFLKGFLWKKFLPAKNKLFYPLTRRSTVHLALILIAIFISTVNIKAREISPDLIVGQESILYSLVSGEEALELIEEGAQTKVLSDNVRGGNLQILDASSSEEDQIVSREEGSILLKPGIALSDNKTRTEIFTYTVEPGDTISSIAQKFNISQETILWANKLSASSIIHPGDKLIILPTSGVLHQVKKGDTLTKIAKIYSVEVEEIIEFNKLADEKDITLGETLVIPGGKIVPPSTPRSRLVKVKEFFIPPKAPFSSARMVWPTLGHRITQYFTWRHSGLDIDGDYSSPIYAAEAGRVVFVGWGGGYGNKIDIDHGNGVITRYGHLSKFLVQKGENVSKGQTIGIMGSTGWSTGTHLHFEVIVGGRRVNPLSYIR